MYSQPSNHQTVLVQTPPNTQPSFLEKLPFGDLLNSPSIWMYTCGGLLLITIAIFAYTQSQIKKLQKSLRFEKFKSQELQKKIKLALVTIKKMETNPDLVHSREFNLDYLRMRMDEEVFHFAIVNRIKISIKDIISSALRPNTANQTVGIASTSGRQVDETFDVTYETSSEGVRIQRVLFRIQIKLVKLPTQSTSATIAQVIECVDKFLGPEEGRENWQPIIQGRIVIVHWDQKAKPTPLLVLETREGGNVTMRDPRQQDKFNQTSKTKNKSAKSKSKK